jgi:hypothetical protein
MIHCVAAAAFSGAGLLYVERQSTCSCHWLLDGRRAVEIAERALACELHPALNASIQHRCQTDCKRCTDVLSCVGLTHLLVRRSWLYWLMALRMSVTCPTERCMLDHFIEGHASRDDCPAYLALIELAAFFIWELHMFAWQ